MDGCIHSSYLAVRKSRPDLNVDVNDLSRFTKVLRNPVCHPWRDRFKQKQPTQNEMSVMSRVYRAFTIVFWARARKTSFCIVGTRQLYHDHDFFCFVIIHLALKKKEKRRVWVYLAVAVRSSASWMTRRKFSFLDRLQTSRYYVNPITYWLGSRLLINI